MMIDLEAHQNKRNSILVNLNLKKTKTIKKTTKQSSFENFIGKKLLS